MPWLENSLLSAAISHMLFALLCVLVYSESFHFSDAERWPDGKQEALTGSWQGCATGITAWALELLRAGLGAPSSPSQTQMTTFPCLCYTEHSTFSFMHFPCLLVFLVKQIIPTKGCYWWCEWPFFLCMPGQILHLILLILEMLGAHFDGEGRPGDLNETNKKNMES